FKRKVVEIRPIIGCPPRKLYLFMSPLYAPVSTLSSVVSAAVLIFYASMLSLPRGYTLGAIVLVAASLWHLLRGPVAPLSQEAKLLVSLLIAMFASGVFAWIYH